jgi:hypothetical protein
MRRVAEYEKEQVDFVDQIKQQRAAEMVNADSIIAASKLGMARLGTPNNRQQKLYPRH